MVIIIIIVQSLELVTLKRDYIRGKHTYYLGTVHSLIFNFLDGMKKSHRFGINQETHVSQPQQCTTCTN